MKNDKKDIKLQFKKSCQHLYFNPTIRKWLKKCEKIINSKKFQKDFLKDFQTQTEKLMIFGTVHPEVDIKFSH